MPGFMGENRPSIIVVGTSAGGMQALCRLVAQLPADFPSAIFIVQHMSVDSSAPVLVKRLSKYTDLTCKMAENLDTIEPSTIYLAPADRHLLLRGDDILVVRGPRENQFRPSIDPLFRSAAAYHGPQVIGVILTGFMTDGVLGMEYVVRSGGIAVAQDPEDAEFPQLVNNVIRQVSTDHVVAIDDMGKLLVKLVEKQASESVTIPTDIWQDAQIVERIMVNSTMSSIEGLEKVGKKAP